MSQSVYELIALAARYVFAGLMLLIVARAWRITIVDSRRAATLRRMSPQTGLSGELVVLEGDEKARRGMRYPVIREGMIGSSRRADIRIRHSSVRRRHAWFQLTPEGLSLRAHAGARGAGEVDCNDTGVGEVIGALEKLLCKLAAALADGHGAEGAVAGVGVGAEDHAAAAGHGLAVVGVDVCHIGGHIDAAVLVGGG